MRVLFPFSELVALAVLMTFGLGCQSHALIPPSSLSPTFGRASVSASIPAAVAAASSDQSEPQTTAVGARSHQAAAQPVAVTVATACWIASAYGYLRDSWKIGIVGGVWGCLAIGKCWREIKSNNNGVQKPQHLLAAWHIRFLGVLAVISGIVLLVVDSPISMHLPFHVGHRVAEAIPLLLVGVAYLAWLAVDRPPIIDLIKQALIAMAFILWGINLLMEIGPWSTFLGAVVISIYVFDLAWLMEGNLRKTIGTAKGTNRSTSPDCRSAGICRCEGKSVNVGTTPMVASGPRASTRGV